MIRAASSWARFYPPPRIEWRPDGNPITSIVVLVPVDITAYRRRM
jgi:hypothetical protein